MGRNLSVAIAVALTLALLQPVQPRAGSITLDEKASPPGQVSVVAVNARQTRVVGLKRFIAMFELARALRLRPAAFNGGRDGAVLTPDVIVVGELSFANLEILAHLLNQRYGVRYHTVVDDEFQSSRVLPKFLINTDTIQQVGDEVTWLDVCMNGTDGKNPRVYQFARLVEVSTGTPFVMAGVHFSSHYGRTGQDDCLARNIAQMRTLLAPELGPVLIGGDFNKRAMTVELECDPDERSEPLAWWSAMTAPTEGGRAYVDSVREWNRARDITMAEEWSFERSGESDLCDGTVGLRRSRIDYIFGTGAAVAEAHADHPGWSGGERGSVHPTNYKYSDHRWIWGRFVLSGPPRPPRPTAEERAFGRVALSWTDTGAAGGWVIYRSVGEHPYARVATLPSDATTYLDTDADHDVAYRYSVAPIGADGGHGQESAGVWARPDARAPHVIATVPRAGATGVARSSSIVVRFDERVEELRGEIRLWRGGQRVGGKMRQRGPREFVFNPGHRLRNGTTYRVVVPAAGDRLGNESDPYIFRFTT